MNLILMSSLARSLTVLTKFTASLRGGTTLEKDMISKIPEKVSDKIILDDDFNLAFKLVFFDENDEEVEPAQYKALSTFSVERELSIQQ